MYILPQIYRLDKCNQRYVDDVGSPSSRTVTKSRKHLGRNGLQFSFLVNAFEGIVPHNFWEICVEHSSISTLNFIRVKLFEFRVNNRFSKTTRIWLHNHVQIRVNIRFLKTINF